MLSFGQEVARLMNEKKMTQAELASVAGVYQSFISKLIRGEQTRLGADVLYKLCDALGVGCDHFRPFLADGDAQTEPEPPAVKRGENKKAKGKKG